MGEEKVIPDSDFWRQTVVLPFCMKHTGQNHNDTLQLLWRGNSPHLVRPQSFEHTTYALHQQPWPAPPLQHLQRNPVQRGQGPALS